MSRLWAVVGKLSVIVAVAWFGFFLTSSEALAAQIFFDPTRSAVIIDGPLVEGDFEQFQSQAAKLSVLQNVILNSEGGQVEPAFQIMDVVRRNFLQPIIPQNGICFSACAYIFMNGYKPSMHYSAELGFHATWLKLSDQEPATGRDIKDAFHSGQQDIKRLLATKKIPIDLILEFLDKGPAELFMIDTVHKARALNISVFGLYDREIYPWERDDSYYLDGIYTGPAPSEISAIWASLASLGIAVNEPLSPENMALVEVTNLNELFTALIIDFKNGGAWGEDIVKDMEKAFKLFRVIKEPVKRGAADALSFKVFQKWNGEAEEQIVDVQFSEHGDIIVYEKNGQGKIEPRNLRSLDVFPPGLRLESIPIYQRLNYHAPSP